MKGYSVAVSASSQLQFVSSVNAELAKAFKLGHELAIAKCHAWVNDQGGYEMTLVFLKKLGATKTVFAISDDISDYTYGKLFNNTGFAQTVPFLGGKFYCGTNINK